MNFRNVQLINALMTVYFGFGSLLFPLKFWGMYGLDIPGEGIWVVRMAGILVISNMVIVLRSRTLDDRAARKVIADFVTIVWSLYFIIALWGQLAGAFNALNWTNVIGALFFAVLTYMVRDR